MAELDPKVIEQYAKAATKAAAEQLKLNAAGVDYNSTLEQQIANLNKISKSVLLLQKAQKDDMKALERLHKADKLRGKDAVQIRRELRNTSAFEKKSIKDYIKLDAHRFRKEEENIKERMKLTEKSVKTELSLYAKMQRDRNKIEKQTGKAGLGRVAKLGKVGGVFRDVFGATSLNPLDMWDRGRSGASKFGDIAKSMKAGRKQKAIATGGKEEAAGGLEQAFGVMGKAVPFLAIAAGITAVVKGLVELGQMITDLNKKFLQVSGPTAGMRNVPKEMEEFNEAIYDLQRNLKLGIKPEEVQQLFSSISGAGMSTEGIKQHIGSFDKIITEARKSSIEFGTSFDKMGEMMTSNMLELRTGLDDVKKSFSELSYDAIKAGISSDKFYTAVENSNTSLSYFGNYLNSTSKLLVSYFKGGNLGFEQAAAATKDLTQAFAGINFEKGMKIIAAGGKGILDIFQKINDEDEATLKTEKAKLEIYNKKNAAGTLTKKEREDYGPQEDLVKSLSEKLDPLTKALESAKKGDYTALSTQIGKLAKEPIKIFQLLEKIGGDGFPGQAKVLSELLGVSEETVFNTNAMLKNMKDEYKAVVSNDNKSLIKEVTGGNVGLLKSLADQVTKRSGDTSQFASVDFEKQMTDAMMLSWRKQHPGLPKGEEDKVQTRIQGFLKDINVGVKDGLTDAIVDLIKSNGDATDKTGDKLDVLIAKAAQNDKANDINKKSDKEQQKTFDEIVSKIFSAKDQGDVLKETLKYVGAKDLGAGINYLTGWTIKGVGYLATLAGIQSKGVLSRKDINDASVALEGTATANQKIKEKIDTDMSDITKEVKNRPEEGKSYDEIKEIVDKGGLPQLKDKIQEIEMYKRAQAINANSIKGYKGILAGADLGNKADEIEGAGTEAGKGKTLTKGELNAIAANQQSGFGNLPASKTAEQIKSEPIHYDLNGTGPSSPNITFGDIVLNGSKDQILDPVFINTIKGVMGDLVSQALIKHDKDSNTVTGNK